MLLLDFYNFFFFFNLITRQVFVATPWQGLDSHVGNP